MISKNNLVKDLKFCKELMDRIIEYADNKYIESHSWRSNHTVIQNDIKRLRRELNEINKKLEWDYKG